MQNGYPPINVKFTDRRQFYDAFDCNYKDDNYNEKVEMVSNDVVECFLQHILPKQFLLIE